MKHLKLYEDFKVNNITEEDIVSTIKNNGSIYILSIKDFPEHDSKSPVKPVDIDGNIIIVDINGKIYQTKLEFVDKIEY